MRQVLRLLMIISCVGIGAMAGPLQFSALQATTDDYQWVRLSNGRVVPLGPGVLCTEECASASLPPSISSRKLLFVSLTGLIVSCALLCRSGHSAPAPVSVPKAGVPETGTLFLLGSGLLLISRRLRR